VKRVHSAAPASRESQRLHRNDSTTSPKSQPQKGTLRPGASEHPYHSRGSRSHGSTGGAPAAAADGAPTSSKGFMSFRPVPLKVLGPSEGRGKPPVRPIRQGSQSPGSGGGGTPTENPLNFSPQTTALLSLLGGYDSGSSPASPPREGLWGFWGARAGPEPWGAARRRGGRRANAGRQGPGATLSNVGELAPSSTWGSSITSPAGEEPDYASDGTLGNSSKASGAPGVISPGSAMLASRSMGLGPGRAGSVHSQGQGHPPGGSERLGEEEELGAGLVFSELQPSPSVASSVSGADGLIDERHLGASSDASTDVTERTPPGAAQGRGGGRGGREGEGGGREGAGSAPGDARGEGSDGVYGLREGGPGGCAVAAQGRGCAGGGRTWGVGRQKSWQRP